MADYYSILGLTKNASHVEIKAAFRRLAKLYHPDKNSEDPNAKLIFENILKAHNTLINPDLRRRYDLSQSDSVYHNISSNINKGQRKTQKEWTFTDEDIKKRQYYQKYYKAKQQTEHIQTQQKTYNDYKYMLFATPLAVGLVMLIVSWFATPPRTENLYQQAENTKPVIQLENGSQPYSDYFGSITTYNTDNIIRINNLSVCDAVIVIFHKVTHQYLQHAYLQRSYYLEFSMLPNEGVYLKCVLGKNWNTNISLNNTIALGGFDSTIQFQNWKKTPILFNKKTRFIAKNLEMIPSTSENNLYISNEIDFFEKAR